MRVLMAGASGFLGTRLARRLRSAEYQLVRLVRREPADPEERRWDPGSGTLPPAIFDGVDAVVTLSGANVGGRRWTETYKRELWSSRVDPTGTVARAIAALPAGSRPRAWLSGSAVGYYGDTGDRMVDETTPPGTGYMADMCRAWEDATAPAADAGVRVTLLRSGLPLDPGGGLLEPLMLPFRLGVGGRLGNGRPYLPWISMPDWLAAVLFLLDNDVPGPVNLTGPEPVRSAELTKALAGRLHRPHLFPVPQVALNVVAGSEFAAEILKSQRVLPEVLTGRGFRFAQPTVQAAVAAAVPG